MANARKAQREHLSAWIVDRIAEAVESGEELVDARTTQEFRDIASRRERDDERAERERGQRGRAGRVC
jgi:hypothetical protein